MNNQLKTLITPDNILSYSKACITLSDTLILLKQENYNRIIIPSRGAYPFWTSAQSALYYKTKSKKSIAKFYLDFNLWLLPYTSDWGDANISIESRQIRKFWTKILADGIRNENTPYNQFYNQVVKTLGKKFTINTSELYLDKTHRPNDYSDEKFIFIDTAISGRAISEVIDSFHEFNLNDFHIILIVDEDGGKLKSKYIKTIEKEKSAGRLTQINVTKIFSEDASPIMNLGISSLVFPSLIETAITEITEFKANNFVGAGLWFIDSVSHLRNEKPHLNGVRGTLNSLILSGIIQLLSEEKPWFSEQVEHDVEMMIKLAGDFDLFNPDYTKELFLNRLSSKGVKLEKKIGLDISSSHVVRINLKSELIKDILKPIKKV